jgi:isoleucyl-tRNA synthetase
MGVHHAWGRTYKDLFCRYHAMLGHDQRWQNGFDCQGLWVEVNVERELGFTSKRDIERYGIAEFVSLCKQRVLTYAALMTEQSIRLGMWMDWNDPDELRRLRDELAADPAQQTTVQGPNGPVTDSVEMIVGRLGLPEIGGSYFTFSNENNDLIWGFLAEVNRRGWLYKGHDSMPWCARCGTGHQPDGDERGLPGPRGPRPDRSLPARRPARRIPARMDNDALDVAGQRRGRRPPRARVRADPPGRRQLLAESWHVEDRRPRQVRGVDTKPGQELVGWRYRGPFDDLPLVRQTFAAGGEQPYEHHIVPWQEVSEDEGTGVVHIAPGAGAEDFKLGKEIGLPVIAPLTEDGHYLAGFDWLSGLDAPGATSRIVEDLEKRDFFYHLEPYKHRYPHCWRCDTPLLFRVVDEWYISMGQVYDKPRDQLTKAEVDASLRYQIMEVVDQIRWLPGFGYERELDWLRTMSDWMISKNATGAWRFRSGNARAVTRSKS